MTWLPWPLIPKPQWPAIRFKEKRAITADENRRIIERETNAERRAFYELCWHLGGSQTDIATLDAKNIDWEAKVIHYARKKTGSIALVRFGSQTEGILRALPIEGPSSPTSVAFDALIARRSSASGARPREEILHTHGSSGNPTRCESPR